MHGVPNKTKRNKKTTFFQIVLSKRAVKYISACPVSHTLLGLNSLDKNECVFF